MLAANRRAVLSAALAACCSVRLPALALDAPIKSIDAGTVDRIKDRIEADRALDAQLREQAVKPNRFGRLEAEPEAAPRKFETDGFNGQRGVDSFGRLAPEFEGDTRELYSNPYAQRLAEKAKTRPDLLAPGKVDIPVYRDGYFSIKPNNILCDDDGRNCKFNGAMPGTATANPRPKYEVPYEETADYRRAQFAEENRLKREKNLAKQAEKAALAAGK